MINNCRNIGLRLFKTNSIVLSNNSNNSKLLALLSFNSKNNSNIIFNNSKRDFTTVNNNNNKKMSGSGSKPGATEENMRIDPKDTLFGKIVSGIIPTKKLYEDDYCIAFDDINPVAPVHVLILPKHPVGGVGDVAHVDPKQHKEAMGHIMYTIPHIASLKGIDSYRLVVNEGTQAQQSVRWLHIHMIGGRAMTWPPG